MTSTWIAASIVAVLAGPADPDVAVGEKAYRAGQYEEAAEAFARAYERTQDPTYLYTQAQAERLSGDCEVAIELYEEFLGSRPSDQAALAVRDNIAECKQRLKVVPPEPKPEPEPEPMAEVAPQPEPTPTPARDEPRAEHTRRNPVPYALFIPGMVAVGVGASLLVVAHRRADAAESASDDRAYGDLLDSAHRLEIAGAVVTSIGAAAIVGGIVHIIVANRRVRRDRTALHVAPTLGGLALSGRIPGRWSTWR
jgi:tetratricopeptide (TPR) repeat protein